MYFKVSHFCLQSTTFLVFEPTMYLIQSLALKLAYNTDVMNLDSVFEDFILPQLLRNIPRAMSHHAVGHGRSLLPLIHVLPHGHRLHVVFTFPYPPRGNTLSTTVDRFEYKTLTLPPM
jgi:hypothetical protein